jgi:hypothetical protein
MYWGRILAYVTGTVDQELLARNEYLATENRIVKDRLKGRLMLSDAERARRDWSSPGSQGSRRTAENVLSHPVGTRPNAERGPASPLPSNLARSNEYDSIISCVRERNEVFARALYLQLA